MAQEFLQFLGTMWPDHKHVVHVPQPQFWLQGWQFQGSLFKHLHIQVSNNWGERWSHCCSFHLFIEVILELEVGRSKAQVGQATYLTKGKCCSFIQGFVLCQFVCDGLHSLIQRNLCKQADGIKANHSVRFLKGGILNVRYKLGWGLHEQVGASWWRSKNSE